MMKDKEYIEKREHFRLLGIKYEEEGNIEKAEHFAGIVRGLDMVFQDGIYKKS